MKNWTGDTKWRKLRRHRNYRRCTKGRRNTKCGRCTKGRRHTKYRRHAKCRGDTRHGRGIRDTRNVGDTKWRKRRRHMKCGMHEIGRYTK
jgi:hypothetical protein